MNEHLLEPLKFYESKGKQLHSENVSGRFDELLAQSGINADENRATVKAYNHEKTLLDGVKKKISKYKLLRGLLIAAVVIGALLAVWGIIELNAIYIGIGAVAIVASLLFITKKMNPLIKNTEVVLSKHEARAAELLSEAEVQMAPLNALFKDDETFRLIEKTIPEMSFEERFSPELKAFLKKEDPKNAFENAEASTTCAVSGSFSKNPFVFLRRLVHTMGVHTYVGSLVIRWTETYRDSEGRTRTRTRTQTLTATVVKPKPYYSNETSLCYATQAAPELSFSRKPTHAEDLSEKQIERKIKAGKKQLEKKAQKSLSEGKSFQEMSNAEFDVLFGATDRDHEVQFRLLFTPLAQRNLTALIKNETGYGDDFAFTKKKELNIIRSEHSQSWSISTSARNYYSYDVDTAKARFESFNNEYFKSVFFDFAPLLSIPAHLDEPTNFLVDTTNERTLFSSLEHEIMANQLGSSRFTPTNARTETILKTRCLSSSAAADTVEVSAYSYATADRVDFVPTLGGDGRIHPVPVPWIEYIPVDSATVMTVSADGKANI